MLETAAKGGSRPPLAEGAKSPNSPTTGLTQKPKAGAQEKSSPFGDIVVPHATGWNPMPTRDLPPPPSNLLERTEIEAFLAGFRLCLVGLKRATSLSYKDELEMLQMARLTAKAIWPDHEPISPYKKGHILKVEK